MADLSLAATRRRSPAGTATVEGDAGILQQRGSTMVDFDPRFEIMPGTKVRGAAIAHADPYEAVPRTTIAE